MNLKIEIGTASRDQLLSILTLIAQGDPAEFADATVPQLREQLRGMGYDDTISLGSGTLAETTRAGGMPAGADTLLREEDQRRAPDTERWIRVFIKDRYTDKEGNAASSHAFLCLNEEPQTLPMETHLWMRESLFCVLRYDSGTIVWKQLKLPKADEGIGKAQRVRQRQYSYPHEVTGIGGRVIDGPPPVQPGDEVIQPYYDAAQMAEVQAARLAA